MWRGQAHVAKCYSAFILKAVRVAAICLKSSVSTFTLLQMCNSEDVHSIYFNAFVNKLNKRNIGNNGEHGNKTFVILSDSQGGKCV